MGLEVGIESLKPCPIAEKRPLAALSDTGNENQDSTHSGSKRHSSRMSILIQKGRKSESKLPRGVQ